IKIPQSSGPLVKVSDEVVHKELGDRMESSSLEAEQDSDAQTRFEAASKQSIDPPLSRFNTLESGEDSHINYALTESLTIYASLIEQFWQTTTLSTIEDGVMEITATIDGRVKTITEASIRRHLKLEDSDGISTLPTMEIFEQLALMGDEGSLSLNELTVLCTSLCKKVESFESEFKQTKQTYSTALIKLIKRVKKLEQTIKTSQARRRAKVVISDAEEDEEDPFK
ncbi:hypothetical protein Tco_0744513, partial [Tanacetum coccineum]